MTRVARARLALAALLGALVAAGCVTTGATRSEADVVIGAFTPAPAAADDAELRAVARSLRAELAERLAWAPGVSFPFRFEAAWLEVAAAPATVGTVGTAPRAAGAADGVVRGTVARGPRGLEVTLTLASGARGTTWRGTFAVDDLGRAASELARALGLRLAADGLRVPAPRDRVAVGAALERIESARGAGATSERDAATDGGDAWTALVRAEALALEGRTGEARRAVDEALAAAPELLGARLLRGALPSDAHDAAGMADEAGAIASLRAALAASPRLPAFAAALVRVVRAAMDGRVMRTDGGLRRVVARAPLSPEETAQLGELPGLWALIEGLPMAPEARLGALVEVAAAHLARGEPMAGVAALGAAREVLAGLDQPQAEGPLGRPATALVVELARRARFDLGRGAPTDAPPAWREVEAYGRAASWADPAARDCAGATLLHTAADRADLALVTDLLARGFDPLAANLVGETPLHRAAAAGHLDVVRVLASGAALEAVDDRGRTPLITAAIAGRVEVVRALADAGAALGARTRAGRTALHEAARLGLTEVVRVLAARGARLGAEDDGGATALALAFVAGERASVEALIAAGAPVDERLVDASVLSALSREDAAPLRARLAALLAERAPAALAIALERALGADVPALARAFMDVGAAPALGPGEGLLHLAARRGLPRLVADLVARGAPVDAQDARGTTPLRAAIEADQAGAVATLLRAHASLAPDADGLRPVDRALLRSPPNDKVLSLLAGPGDLEVLAYRGDVRGLTTALQADPTAVTRLYPDGLGLLHHAVRGNQLEVVTLLVKRGAPVGLAAAAHIAHAPEVEGWTPLHFAFAQGLEPMVRLLVGLGGSVDARDARARAAWQLAAMLRDEDLATKLERFHVAATNPTEGTEADLVLPRSERLPLGVRGDVQDKEDDRPPHQEKVIIGSAFIETGVDPGRLGHGAAIAERGLQLAPAFENLQLLLRSSYDARDDGGPAEGLEPTLVRCYRVGAWPEARRVAADLLAARLDPDGRRPLLVAFARQNLALAEGQLGDLAPARERFGQALAELAESYLAGPRATVLENRADVARRMADWPAAVADLRQALAERSSRGQMPELRVVPLLLLGLVLGEWGRYADAVAAVREGLAVAAAGWGESHPVTLLARGNLGALLDALGARAEARRLNDAQLAALRALGAQVDPIQLGIAEINGAHYAFVAHELAPALALARAAVERVEAHAPGHFVLGQMLLIQGDIVLAAGHPDEAAAIFGAARDRLRATFGEVTGVVAGATRRLAEVRAATDRAGAEALLLEAWATAAQADAPEERWPIERDLALLAAAADRLPSAIFFGKQAVATLELIRAHAAGVGDALERSLVESRIEVWRQLADWLVEAGRLDEATAVLGLLKDDEVASLATRGGRTQSPAAARPDVPTTPSEGKARAALEAKARLLADAGAELRALAAEDASKGLDQDGKKKLEGARDRVRESRRAFEKYLQEVEADLPRLTADRVADIAAMNLRDAAALEGTLGTLGHGAVLVHYLVGPDKLRILVTTPTHQVGRTVDVATAALNALAFKLREALGDPHADPTEVAGELYQLMIAPIEKDLREAKAETLMVSLDGVLRYVPLAALWDGERWLVERFRLALFSRAALPALTQRLDGPMRVAALGLAKRVQGFSALPEVPAELEGIVRRDDAKDGDGVVPGAIWLDAGFSREALLGVLEGRTYTGIHIASHFVFEPGTEADSFLLLGNGEHLTLEDMRYDLRFDGVDLLSLSACNTALGGGASDEPRQGRELEGFAALTQRLGARTVLATLWPVADQSTAELMRALYAIRQRDPALTKADALREAQLGLIREPGGRHAHPYFWAPFVLMGAWL